MYYVFFPHFSLFATCDDKFFSFWAQFWDLKALLLPELCTHFVIIATNQHWTSRSCGSVESFFLGVYKGSVLTMHYRDVCFGSIVAVFGIIDLPTWTAPGYMYWNTPWNLLGL
jgi:hypothetical protein